MCKAIVYASVWVSILLLPAHLVAAIWSQQYGDAASANYIAYNGSAYPPWNYTVRLTTQADIVSPAVSTEGVLFFVIPPYRDDSTHAGHIVALAPNGKVLWKVQTPGSGKSEIELSNLLSVNLLIREGQEVVIAGVNEVVSGEFYLFALYAIDGLLAWQSERVKDFKCGATIAADAAGTLAVGGSHKSGNGSLLVFSLENGILLWTSETVTTSQYGMRDMQVKAIESDGAHVFLLPTDPNVGSIGGVGRLHAFRSTYPWGRIWESSVFFGNFPLLAVSMHQRMVYGTCIGSQPFNKNIYAVSTENGMVVFHITAFACGGPGPEGITVDGHGYVYYSCVRQVLSLHPNGTLRWLSDVIGSCFSGTGGLAVDTADDSLYYYYCDDKLVKLSLEDGSIKKVYDIPPMDRTQDSPILVGSKFAWRFGYVGFDLVVHTIVL